MRAGMILRGGLGSKRIGQTVAKEQNLDPEWRTSLALPGSVSAYINAAYIPENGDRSFRGGQKHKA